MSNSERSQPDDKEREPPDRLERWVSFNQTKGSRQEEEGEHHKSDCTGIDEQPEPTAQRPAHGPPPSSDGTDSGKDERTDHYQLNAL